MGPGRGYFEPETARQRIIETNLLPPLTGMAPARRPLICCYVDRVSISPGASGEQCPQCGQADLRPYGNGSKWACPRCYFVLPCCEGGELSALLMPGQGATTRPAPG
jgi:hypothetical protein